MLCQRWQINIYIKGLSGETYPDRKAGAIEGVYEVSDLSLTPYLVPQECGMRMDTEWVDIVRHTESSIIAGQIIHLKHFVLRKKMSHLLFHGLPYTASEIENALHHEELPPTKKNDSLYLWSGSRCWRH